MSLAASLCLWLGISFDFQKSRIEDKRKEISENEDEEKRFTDKTYFGC